MTRKPSSTQARASETPRGRGSKHGVRDVWQQQLDQPGDRNYLGVSVVFRQFAEPMLAGGTSLGEITVGCQIAMLAWNLAALAPHLRPKLLAPALLAMPVEIQALIRQYLSMLIARKEQQFEQYHWFIEDFKVDGHAGDIRLSVVVSELEMDGATAEK
jgi:hypothetical protein